MNHLARQLILGSLALVLPVAVNAQSAPTPLKFEFSDRPPTPGYTLVAPTTPYLDAAGFGFEPGALLSRGDNVQTLTSEKPFSFSAKVPEGNYTVTITGTLGASASLLISLISSRMNPVGASGFKLTVSA